MAHVMDGDSNSTVSCLPKASATPAQRAEEEDMAYDKHFEKLVDYIQDSVLPFLRNKLSPASEQEWSQITVRAALIAKSAVDRESTLIDNPYALEDLRNTIYQSILNPRPLSSEETQNSLAGAGNPVAIPSEKPKRRVQLSHQNLDPSSVVWNSAFAWPTKETSGAEDADELSEESDSSLSEVSVGVTHIGRPMSRRDALCVYNRHRQQLRELRCEWVAATPPGSDDDALPPLEEYDPSDTSSTFLRELEEEEEEEKEGEEEERNVNSLLSAEEVSEIIAQCIDEYISSWRDRKLNIHLAKLRNLWYSFASGYSRYKACKAAEAWLARLDSRLEKFKEGIMGPDTSQIRRQCLSLQETVEQREEFRLKAEVLGHNVAPAKIELDIKPRRRRRAPSTHESDPEGIDLDTESDVDDFIVIDGPSINKPPAQSSGLKSHSDGGCRKRTPSQDLIDLTMETESVDESSERKKSNTGNSTHKKKKKKQADSTAKRYQTDAWRRAQEDEERSRQNDEAILRTGRMVVNPGRFDDEQFIFIGEHLAGHLRPHQLEGIRFMWREIMNGDASNASGCILAHTMGLGKTLQAITLLSTIHTASEHNRKQIPADLRKLKALIICPPSLIDNWLREFKVWLPHENSLGPVLAIQAGSAPPSRLQLLQMWRDIGCVLVIGNHIFRDIVNTSEESADEDVEADVNNSQSSIKKEARKLLNEVANIVIIDEAHSAKNRSTDLAKSVMNISCRRRIALSGTPISNSLDEYWALIDWTSPGYLGSHREFRSRFTEPIKDGSYEDSTKEERRKAKIRLKALEKVLDPKVHRREIDVLKADLKPKHEFIIEFCATNQQKKICDAFIDIICPNGSKLEALRIVSLEKDLKLLVNHPTIFQGRFEALLAACKKKSSKEKGYSEGGYTPDQISRTLKVVKQSISGNEISSWKVEMLLFILSEAKTLGDKVIVFSYSIPTLDYLEKVLKSRGRSYLQLDGRTKTQERQQILDRFNSSNRHSVFLISAEAGGQGVNIQSANRVIMFDFSWSPAVEEQAIGRAYRLGQTKTVYVYRFIVGGTHESALLHRTIFKQQLTDRVLSKKGTDVSGIRVEDLVFKVKQTAFASADELSRHRKHDPILDKMMDLNSTAPCIASITTREDHLKKDEYIFTVEDENEVDRLVEEERKGIRLTTPDFAAPKLPSLGLASFHPNTQSNEIPDPSPRLTLKVPNLPSITEIPAKAPGAMVRFTASKIPDQSRRSTLNEPSLHSIAEIPALELGPPGPDGPIEGPEKKVAVRETVTAPGPTAASTSSAKVEASPGPNRDTAEQYADAESGKQFVQRIFTQSTNGKGSLFGTSPSNAIVAEHEA